MKTLSAPPSTAAQDEPTDEALMQRYGTGDASAFELLYARHRVGLFRFIHRQCSQKAQAEEIFQEVWMGLIQGAARYEPSAKFRTFLYTMAHNRLVDFYRRSSAQKNVTVLHPFNEDESSESPLEQIAGSRVEEPLVRLLSREQGEQFLAVLEQLPPAQREAFLLYEEGELSIEEIAAATHVSFEAAKSRLRYAIAKLRAGLAHLTEEARA